jgi:hypothetical protein
MITRIRNDAHAQKPKASRKTSSENKSGARFPEPDKSLVKPMK